MSKIEQKRQSVITVKLSVVETHAALYATAVRALTDSGEPAPSGATYTLHFDERGAATVTITEVSAH